LYLLGLFFIVLSISTFSVDDPGRYWFVSFQGGGGIVARCASWPKHVVLGLCCCDVQASEVRDRPVDDDREMFVLGPV
jgi:hypothetical protein